MDVTFCKCHCHSFTLCLPYAKPASYSIGYVQISNDAKLNMTDGTYKDFVTEPPRGGVRRQDQLERFSVK
jgi:hypothetical protein